MLHRVLISLFSNGFVYLFANADDNFHDHRHTHRYIICIYAHNRLNRPMIHTARIKRKSASHAIEQLRPPTEQRRDGYYRHQKMVLMLL
jgi:hypothetical protein